MDSLHFILGPDHKFWNEKVIKIKPKVKEWVVRQYFNRQIFDNKLRFMQWYINEQNRKHTAGVIK